MRILSKKFHAILDYISALILIAAPWLFDFSDIRAATYFAVVAGFLIIVLSILTDYEGGLFRTVSMWTHLAFDVTLGAILLSSPWVFGFNDQVYLPHLLMGSLAIGAGYLTKGGPINVKSNAS